MGDFESLLGDSVKESQETLDKAMAMAQKGQAVDAVELMEKCVSKIADEKGVVSKEHAGALFHFSKLCSALGDLKNGAKLCQNAADACPDTEECKKARFMFLMNVGQLLVHSGDHENAIKVLERNLEERTAFYDPDHAGVAYGQHLLSEALLPKESYRRGIELAEQAAALFLKLQHHEFPGAYALRAAHGFGLGIRDEKLWPNYESWPEDLLTELFQQTYQYAQLMNDELGAKFLRSLVEVSDKCSSGFQIQIVSALNNVATEKSDFETLNYCADRMPHLIAEESKVENRVHLMQGLALTYSNCGRPKEEVRKLYQQTSEVAKDNELSELRAAVLRNWAIFEAETDPKSASDLYDEAIELARALGKAGVEILGRNLIAKGILLQHNDSFEPAKELLEEAIDMLPATHPDASCGVLHLAALNNNLDCCCKSGEAVGKEAISMLAKVFFEQSGFEDLLAKVGIDEGGLQVELAREPTEAELERLRVAHSVFLSQIQR